jgi:hypothetical protein
MSNDNLINSWRQASDDLQIKIQIPFILTTDNLKIKFELLVENFGSKLGTVILSIDNMVEIDTPEKYGYYCSAINPDNYSIYNRQFFIDTLNDWGYFGDKSKTPEWYTGQPWTE